MGGAIVEVVLGRAVVDAGSGVRSAVGLGISGRDTGPWDGGEVRGAAEGRRLVGVLLGRAGVGADVARGGREARGGELVTALGWVRFGRGVGTGGEGEGWASVTVGWMVLTDGSSMACGADTRWSSGASRA